MFSFTANSQDGQALAHTLWLFHMRQEQDESHIPVEPILADAQLDQLLLVEVEEE